MTFEDIELALGQLDILIQLNRSINEDFQRLYNQKVLQDIRIIKDRSIGGYYLNREIQQLIDKLQACIDNTNTMTDYNIHRLNDIICILRNYINL